MCARKINFDKKKVISAFTNNTECVDNSNGLHKEVIALIELNNEDREFAQYYCAQSQRLNAVYYDALSGTLRLSQMNVGGVFYGELTLENIIRFNNSVDKEKSKIKRVIFRDGTEINVA